jgi:hypothetical protein
MKYMVAERSNDQIINSDVFDTSTEITDAVSWQSDLYYVIEFSDSDPDIAKIQKPDVISTVTTTQNKDNVVDDFTVSFDAVRHNARIDEETFQLIKDWCKGEAEGCEEAFINLGIADDQDTRYQAYLTEKTSIKSSQAAKKV